MDSAYICKGEKYKYSKGYIYLPVEAASFPQGLKIKGNTLQLKSSFHASLVCVKNILEQHPQLEQKVLDHFCKFTAEHDISFDGYTSELRFAEEGEKKSLVALCKVTNLAAFFDSLNAALSIDIPCQPAHVTLYTLQPDIGIGLTSQEEMEKKSVPIDVGDMTSLRKTESSSAHAVFAGTAVLSMLGLLMIGFVIFVLWSFASSTHSL